MQEIDLTIKAPCEYSIDIGEKDCFYCLFNKKKYKGYSTCNKRCSIGRKKIEAVEKAIYVVIERSKNDNRK